MDNVRRRGDEIETRTIGAYLDALASEEPTPGGGSAVAVAGSLATALGEMVCRLTVDHPDYADAAADLRERLAVLAELRQRFVALAAADEAAYGRYIEASALPRVTDEEKCARRRVLQAALAGAADVPLAVMTTCLNLATALEPVAREGNRHLLSDVLAAAHLTRAVAAGAAESVRANTTLIRDDDERAPREARRDRLAAEIETAIANLTAAASTRL